MFLTMSMFLRINKIYQPRFYPIQEHWLIARRACRHNSCSSQIILPHTHKYLLYLRNFAKMVRMVMGMMVMLMVRERVLVLVVRAVRWRLLLDDIALVVDAKPNMNCIIQNRSHDRDYNPQIQMRSASSLSTAASTLQRSKSLAAADRLDLSSWCKVQITFQGSSI